MSSVSASLQRAVQLHRSGELDQAADLYRQALAVEPDNVDAHHLLGVIELARGQNFRALEHLKRAVQHDHAPADFYIHLAAAHQANAQMQEAICAYRKAIALDPGSATACHQLGNALVDAGHRDEAEACYRRAIALDPKLTGAYNNLGALLQDAGRKADALECLREAARLCPGMAEIHFNLGSCYQALGMLDEAAGEYRQAQKLAPDFAFARHALGGVLQSLQRYAEAAECHREAVRLQPEFVDAINEWGVALRQLDKTVEAEAHFRHALQLAPDHPAAQLNLAVAIHAQHRWSEAQIEYEKCLRMTPDNRDVLMCLAECLRSQNKFTAAISRFERVFQIEPENATAHHLCGMARLSIGDFAGGWRDFEWRLKTKYAGHRFTHPRWQGEPLYGQRILLYADWGLGDALQFVRFERQLEERGGDVTIAVEPALIPLLKQSGYQQLVAIKDGDNVDCQWQVAMLSLPLILGITPNSIPAEIPYLSADPQLVELWGARLAKYPGLRIGIHWGGSAMALVEGRNIPLAEFEPLARLPGVTLFSLQKPDGTEQPSALKGQFELVDFGSELDEAHGPFMDTAAIMRHLDLVITSDTSTAHLAGALGVKVWVALRHSVEWRWMTAREDSPWYPTMRLFRQTTPGVWSDVFERMSVELARIAAPRSATSAAT